MMEDRFRFFWRIFRFLFQVCQWNGWVDFQGCVVLKKHWPQHREVVPKGLESRCVAALCKQIDRRPLEKVPAFCIFLGVGGK